MKNKTNIRNWINSIVIFSMVFLISSSITYASIIDIEIKDSFSEGETIEFDYIISSFSGGEVIYVTYVICPSGPDDTLIENSATLGPGELLTGTHSYMTVNESIEPQTCTAYVAITDPYEIVESTTFEIVTDPGFEFDAYSCKDQSCTQKSKTFLKSDDIYLNYESDVSGITVSGTLTMPNRMTQQLTLPTSIKASQVGTYTLEATASKEGYKTTTKFIQFGVISKEADIKTTGEVSGIVWWGWLEGIKTSYILIIVFVIAVFSVTTLFLRGKLKSLSK